jgi:hypothetical protein
MPKGEKSSIRFSGICMGVEVTSLPFSSFLLLVNLFHLIGFFHTFKCEYYACMDYLVCKFKTMWLVYFCVLTYFYSIFLLM